MDSITTEGPAPSQQKPVWKRNLVILWIGCFLNGIGFSLIMPFLSLYIQSLGHYSEGQTEFLSGVAFSATFITMAVVSPIWGKIADRKGRKLMLLRSALGIAISISAMGLAPNVGTVIVLRAIQGILSGYVSNATALMATSAPENKAGRVLGVLSTGVVSGTLIGPMVGGIISNFWGYRVPFFITGAVGLIMFFLTLFFVKEDFTPITKKEQSSTKEILAKLPYPKLIIGMFVTTMLIQACNNSIGPMMSLYVQKILGTSHNISIISGFIASIPGIATLIAAPQLGKLGDKIGAYKVLLAGLVLAILVYIPQGFVTNVWQLAGLRFLVGISDAALLPQVQSILTRFSPHEDAGMIFSYNQSFMSVGNFLGPLIGGVVSGAFGFTTLFLVTASMMFVNLVLVNWNTSPLRHNQEN